MNSFTLWWDKNVEKPVTDFRIKLLKPVYFPVLKFLMSVGVSPNMISHLKLLFVIPLLFYLKTSPLLAVLFVVLKSFIDGFDGALARFEKVDNDKGKFVDLNSDILFYLAFIIGLVYYSFISFYTGLFNVLITVYVSAYAVLFKRRHTRTDWVVKPYIGGIEGFFRFLPFVFYFYFAFTNIDYINVVLVPTNYILLILTLLYYRGILKND